MSLAKTAIAKLQQDQSDLKRSSTALSDLLQHQSEAPKLDVVTADLLVAVMHERLEHGITVAAVTPGKTVATQGASALAQMADKVEQTEVRSARVNVRGNYDNYAGLLGYIDTLRGTSVAVVYLKVEGRQFELGLRAYGL